MQCQQCHVLYPLSHIRLSFLITALATTICTDSRKFTDGSSQATLSMTANVQIVRQAIPADPNVNSTSDKVIRKQAQT